MDLWRIRGVRRFTLPNIVFAATYLRVFMYRVIINSKMVSYYFAWLIAVQKIKNLWPKKLKLIFRHLNNISSVLESMLRIKISIVPGELLSVYAQNIAKLYSVLLVKYEADDDWDSVESLDHLMLSKLPDFQFTDHLEAQQRV